MHLPVERRYLFAAWPYLTCAPVVLLLARLCDRRRRGPGLDLPHETKTEIAG